MRLQLDKLDKLDKFADFDARLLPLVSPLVPERKRADWAREWRAELWHLRHARRPNRQRKKSAAGELATAASLAWGLVADAAWLRWDWLKQTAPGSAEWCLTVLFGACLFSAAAERVLAGSWHGFAQTLDFHLLHSFAFVSVPAMFAAMVTHPLKELRWERKETRRGQWLSARARWNAFLAAKVVLTLALAFLITVVLSVALRQLTPSMYVNWIDWLELFTSAPLVSVGLRWALLNQEQRCQKCLRMLSQPTRLGPPSHNFLHWSGTELACSEGHGLLHVPEMQGSWCWYDRWVELEPAWSEVAYL